MRNIYILYFRIQGSCLFTEPIASSNLLVNVAFLRTRIEQIDVFIGQEEIDEIWITFPDPFLKKSKKNRRLTSHGFINRYRKILKKGGRIHLKTDSEELFAYSMEVIQNDRNLTLRYSNPSIYERPLINPDLEILW